MSRQQRKIMTRRSLKEAAIVNDAEARNMQNEFLKLVKTTGAYREITPLQASQAMRVILNSRPARIALKALRDAGRAAPERSVTDAELATARTNEDIVLNVLDAAGIQRYNRADRRKNIIVPQAYAPAVNMINEDLKPAPAGGVAVGPNEGVNYREAILSNGLIVNAANGAARRAMLDQQYRKPTAWQGICMSLLGKPVNLDGSGGNHTVNSVATWTGYNGAGKAFNDAVRAAFVAARGGAGGAAGPGRMSGEMNCMYLMIFFINIWEFMANAGHCNMNDDAEDIAEGTIQPDYEEWMRTLRDAHDAGEVMKANGTNGIKTKFGAQVLTVDADGLRGLTRHADGAARVDMNAHPCAETQDRGRRLAALDGPTVDIHRVMMASHEDYDKHIKGLVGFGNKVAQTPTPAVKEAFQTQFAFAMSKMLQGKTLLLQGARRGAMGEIRIHMGANFMVQDEA